MIAKQPKIPRKGSQFLRHTIDGGGQQCCHNLPLSFLVFVEETLETVQDSTAKHKRLSLIHHGHEQHHNGWSVRRGVERKRLI